LHRGGDDTPDRRARGDIPRDGVLITLPGKTGWREAGIALGPSDPTGPIDALARRFRTARTGV
jgi:hypothetical protein